MKNNISGVPGVDWKAQRGLRRAAICFKGRRYYLGGCRKFEDAFKARKQAKEVLHNRFVREFSASGSHRAAGG